uniref:NFACT RNA-binding domain-containing protein n=1 Tax=Neobodo designis TaxID=312471 RepID=A0A7S1M5N6_NEODS|mmetsp:Transcript_34717/g.107224  ORF Transcript_34717/g.107224 Transcript_34717/m.107224 type:complete len:207 (+) Transcript_34717:32-652(+)|eukprot:CAMPEP_0174850094 /NCGR_PEP_ID=MMETSP1114-20130205/19036_1 /TAXON_ID=312471 /ORGANISM="Neobodo designis, Strain CCAP 1951/1" /LENGTH=206 /DNA_ID=CAMNT_0016084527 /DNA_START=33 /DNA_END=653 /DNA_ORIENTATION=+
MVFFFTLRSNPNVICYMGRDKHENEELIRWGWPEDWWFHVDSLSSAHVYVRLPYGASMDELTEEMIEECCQLVKANSIQGCKLNNVRIVYTPWANLKKTGDMDVGQVGYHDDKKQRFFTVAKKNNAMINALEKTRVEKDLDFRAEREERDRRVNAIEREKARKEAEEEREREAERKRIADQKAYKGLHDQDMEPNVGDVPDEDDFM